MGDVAEPSFILAMYSILHKHTVDVETLILYGNKMYLFLACVDSLKSLFLSSHLDQIPLLAVFFLRHAIFQVLTTRL